MIKRVWKKPGPPHRARRKPAQAKMACDRFAKRSKASYFELNHEYYGATLRIANR